MRRGENFPLLDGLRGIAALAVLLFHARQILGDTIPAGSAYLAVDFFFMLSGFVVCAAYGQRLAGGLSWRRFMAIRLIRLWPMLAIGALLGGTIWTVNRIQKFGPHAALGEGLFVTAGALLLLPVGLLHGAQAFPADNPIWSLFFEIAANAFYAVRVRVPRAVWIAGIFLSALALLLLAQRYGSIATFGFNDPLTFLAGFPRVAVPFAVGALLYREKAHRFLDHFPAWIPPLVLAGVLIVGTDPAWIFDLAATVVVFPLLVSAAAGSRLGIRGTRPAWISGELSYPAYLVHQPILRGLRGTERWLHVQLPLAEVTVLAIALTLVASWLLLKYVDKPVRRALDHRFLKDKCRRDVMLEPAL